ncbi:MAG: ADP-ribosylglycohydrolase family protein, partial [Clostridia bacterium]|nr:ADP-ribosylglycohydrolase family protein [Clostridia bacterium]
MIFLSKDFLRDKIHACFIGKNIGGTIGTPFEGKIGPHDVRGFNSAPGEPLPNDDLDLQLIWLCAIEQNGAR